MGVNRREALIDAGVDLLCRQRFQDLLATVETRAIAEEAGVTTGSFFHHFRNRAHFAQVVADRFVEEWTGRVTRLSGHAKTAVIDSGLRGLRPAAAAEWAGLADSGHRETLQHLLWSARDHVLCDETSRTAGELLADGYRMLTDTVVPTYRRGITTMGREMMPPFTTRDLAVLMAALGEGLQMRAAVDPEGMRDDLYVDAVSVFLLGLTRPRVQPDDDTPPVDLASLEARFQVQPPPDEPGEDPVATWRHIVDAAAHLFTDRSPSDVRMAEVAAAAGVTPAVVVRQLGTVHAVAALGFGRHLPELEAIAAQPVGDGEDPLGRVEQLLTRYVELVRTHRGAAEAMVTELMAEMRPAPGTERPHSFREHVPLPALLRDPIRELRARGRLRRHIESDRMARSLIHLVTMQALLFPDESIDQIVDQTTVMVFDGALRPPTDP